MAEIGELIEYDKLEKVKVGQIRDTWSYTLDESMSARLRRAWRKTTTPSRLTKIKESILEFGYNPEKYGYIEVHEGDWDGKPYRAADGNHRVRVLKELYGEDHEVTVMVKVNKKETNNIPEELDGLWPNLWDGISTIPITLLPSIIFFLWYMFLEVIVVSFTLYFFATFTTDIRSRANQEVHPKKGLGWVYDNANFIYSALMFLYYNYRMIVIGLIISIYTYHVITTHFIGLLIIGAITLLLKFFTGTVYGDINIGMSEIINKIKNK